MNKKERRNYIGGSDVHHVLSVEPYGCARRLWYEKRETPEDYTEADNPYYRKGNLLEEPAAQIFMAEMKTILKTPKHKTRNDFFSGHCDREIVNAAGERDGIWEGKAPSRNVYQQIKKTGIPLNYVLQVQYYLWLYNYLYGWITVLYVGDSLPIVEALHLEIKRDEELILQILDACHNFWRMLLNGPAPEQLAPTDARCQKCLWRKTCQGLGEISLLPEEGDYQIVNEPVLEQCCADYKEAQGLIKEAEELKNERGEALKILMGERQKVATSAGKICYQQIAKESWDTKLLDKTYPEMKMKFLKQTNYRSLRVF